MLLCRTLQRGSLSSQATEYVCAALKKVFSTAYGKGLSVPLQPVVPPVTPELST